MATAENRVQRYENILRYARKKRKKAENGEGVSKIEVDFL